MSSTAMTHVSAVGCSVCRRSFVAAELLSGKVAADTARSPSLSLNSGREVNRSLLAARLRVVGLPLNNKTMRKINQL